MTRFANSIMASLFAVCFVSSRVQAVGPEGAQQIVYARDYVTCAFPGVCDGSRIKPWISADGTGGIKGALDACFSSNGDSADGCIVVLPKGYVKITATINVSGDARQEGLVFRGHGAGERATASSVSFAGTDLLWYGSAGGTVMRIAYTSWSRFEDFAIDGDPSGDPARAAGKGIQVTASVSVAPAQQNIFQNVFICGILGTPHNKFTGHAVELVGTDLLGTAPHQYYNDEVSETLFDHLFVANSTVGFFEDSRQSTDIHITNSNFQFCDFGIDLQDGELITTNADFNAREGGSEGTSVADVWVSSSAADFTAFRNYHETYTGSTYVFSNVDRTGATCGGGGACRTASTALYSPKVLVMRGNAMCADSTCASPANWIIHHLVSGPLTVIGGTFFLYDQGAQWAPISVEGAAYPSPVNTVVSTAGNVFGSGVVWKLNGEVTLVGQEGPATISSGASTVFTPPGSASAMDLWKTGLVLGGDHGLLGSITFTDDDHRPRFSTSFGSSLLAWNYSDPVRQGDWHTMAYMATPEEPFWFPGRNDVTGASGAGMTRLHVDEATHDETATLRNLSGTLLLSGQDGLTGDVSATFAAGFAFSAIQPNVLKPSEMNVTNDAVAGYCAAKSSGDQFTWIDVATRSTPQALTNKTLTDSSNVFPGLGMLSMSGVIAAANAATCLGPGGAVTESCASGSASDSASPMPAMTLRSMRCRTGASFESGRSWTLSLRINGADQAGWRCTFDSSSTSCAVAPPGGLTLAAGDLIDLRSTGNGTQAPSGRLNCSVGIGF
jgi:hypothetical protein